MRTAFLLATLVVSGLYTYVAFADLAFLSSAGRLGPGFFPRVIGIGLLAMCLCSLYADLRARRDQGEPSSYRALVATIAVLSGLFVAMLDVLGGVLAMIAFLLMTLTVLNRGSPTLNAVVALALPIAVYLLFDRWLNASMPSGMVPFPI